MFIHIYFMYIYIYIHTYIYIYTFSRYVFLRAVKRRIGLDQLGMTASIFSWRRVHCSLVIFCDVVLKLPAVVFLMIPCLVHLNLILFNILFLLPTRVCWHFKTETKLQDSNTAQLHSDPRKDV